MLDLPQLAERDGNGYPLMTLQMGVAFHRAMIDVRERFEGELRKSLDCHAND